MLHRWLSALSALAVLFGSLYWGGPTALAVLSSLVIFIVAVEYSLLFHPLSLWSFVFYITGLCVFLSQIFLPQWLLAVLSVCFVSLGAFGICLFPQSEPQDLLKKIYWPLVGLIYVCLLPALAISILLSSGWKPILFLLVTVFCGDVLAFFFGLSLGGKKVFPLISPKKTYSGAAGGLLGSLVFGGGFLIVFSQLRDPIFITLLCLFMGFFAQLGDFFESLLKRISGKKDSGNIMPGHGGLLDRLDGVYFGSAILYAACVFFGLAGYFN